MPIPCPRRAIAVLLLFVLCGAAASRAPAQNAPDERRVGQLLGQHCARCHNPRLANAGIDLSTFDGVLDVWRYRGTFSRVLDMVGRGMMPPASAPGLAAADRAFITDWLGRTLQNVDVDRIPRDPGSVPPRRLTRVEYRHTLRDLFGVDVEPAAGLFPPDQRFDGGFDNEASALTVEPRWFERALDAAEAAVRAVWDDPAALDRLLVARPSPPPPAERAAYTAPAERSRALDLGRPFTVLARISGEAGNVFLKAPPGAGFRRGSKDLGWEDGALVYRISHGEVLRAEDVLSGAAGPRWVALVAGDRRASLYVDGRLVASRAGFGRPDQPEHLFKVAVRPQPYRPRGDDEARAESPGEAPGLLGLWYFPSALPAEALTRAMRDPLADALSGPLPAPRFRWGPGLETPAPDGFVSVREAGERVLTRFLERAFRRPPGDGEADRYLRLFQAEIDAGAPFELALQLPVTAALASPAFLLRTEADSGGPGIHLVPSLDLASRLSYFLWSSMPDAELLEAARDGRLADPDELARQTDRMLADPKADRFFEHFVQQWLRTEGLGETVVPDRGRFPEATPGLLAAMRREAVLVFADLVRRNRSVHRLLDDDRTFMNGALAAHYGYDEVRGPEWRRVRLRDAGRGGLLTQAGVLTVSSSPRRTSPVFRGAWVLDVLLGEPPPPPPPDVPELPAEADSPATSQRALLEAHRANPVCAGCHARIDPYGLALEQYDAIGRLRPEPQDTATTLFDGRRLEGADDLKRYLAGEKATGFVRHLVRRLLTYALGRRLSFPDDRSVEIILQRLEEEGWGAAALIREIVLSDPFRFRRVDFTPGEVPERPDSGPDPAPDG